MTRTFALIADDKSRDHSRGASWAGRECRGAKAPPIACSRSRCTSLRILVGEEALDSAARCLPARAAHRRNGRRTHASRPRARASAGATVGEARAQRPRSPKPPNRPGPPQRPYCVPGEPPKSSALSGDRHRGIVVRHGAVGIPVLDRSVDREPPGRRSTSNRASRADRHEPDREHAAPAVRRWRPYVTEVRGRFIGLLPKPAGSKCVSQRQGLRACTGSRRAHRTGYPDGAIGRVFDHGVQTPYSGPASTSTKCDRTPPCGRGRRGSRRISMQGAAQLRVVAGVRGEGQLLEAVEPLVVDRRNIVSWRSS